MNVAFREGSPDGPISWKTSVYPSARHFSTASEVKIRWYQTWKLHSDNKTSLSFVVFKFLFEYGYRQDTTCLPVSFRNVGIGVLNFG